MSKLSTFACATLTVAVFAGPALSQSIGAEEFMNSCAQCHGADGMGNGPIAPYLTASPPDLTKLAASNGGVFPLTNVYRVIEGEGEMGPHGTREMPAWGRRYQAEGLATANPDFANEQAETFAKFRILALTEYLSTIQTD